MLKPTSIAASACAQVRRGDHHSTRAYDAHNDMPFPSQHRSGNGTSSNNGGNGTRAREQEQRSRAHGRPDRPASSRLERVLTDMHDMVGQLRGMSDVSARERSLQDDNFKLRRRNARLLDEIEVLGDGIPEGSHVITDDEHKELEALRGILKEAKIEKPSQLKTLVDEFGKLKASAAESEIEQKWTEAAEELDVPNVKAFVKAMMKEGLHVEFKEERVRDPEDRSRRITKRTPMVRKAADDKAVLTALDEYVDEHMAEFIPAFNAEPEGKGDQRDAEDDDGGADDRPRLGRSDISSDSEDVDDGDVADFRPRLGRRDSQSRSGSASSSSGVPLPAMRGARAPQGGRRISDADFAKKKRDVGGVDYSL